MAMSDGSAISIPDAPEPPPPDETPEGEGDPIDWVTVAHFFNPEDAHIARLKLGGEGIDCFIADEYAVGMFWQDAIAFGGAKLKVPVQSAVAAAAAPATGQKSANTELLHGEGVCPRCGSSDISNAPTWRRFLCLVLISILLMQPIAIAALLGCGTIYLLVARTRRCADCGFEWNAKHGHGPDVAAAQDSQSSGSDLPPT